MRRKKELNLDEISEGFGGTPGGSEDVIDSSELQDLLGDPSVSTYYGTQSDIRVKSYWHLNFLPASIFNLERVDILQD